MRQEPNMKAAEGAGLTMDNLDFEFMTRGDPVVQAKDTAGRFQQNLTPEEINEMAELAPYAEKFMLLTIKGETGRIPSEEDVNQLLQQTTQEMASTNEQGMPSEQGSGTRVPQDMQSEAMVPSRPVEGQMPQNAPEMMSKGGKVDLSGILEGDKFYFLISGLDRSTPTTKDGETIRSLHTFHDGNWIVFPSIRMKDGKLKQLGEEVPRGYSNPRGISFDKAFNETLNKKDYIVVPARDDKEAEAYSKAISDEIGRRRGMQMGGVAAGPVGVVDKPGADNSGVADDVPAESDGFVINAAAVRHAGLRDINDMIQDAKEYAEKQGMKLNFGKTPVDAEQILVSNGEVVIPDVIANIIGYDRLEKINNRGKKETEEKIQQQEQQPQQPAPTRQPAQPVMQAAEGGEVFPAESALIQHERDKSRELATKVYDALAVPETGGEKDPFIRTRVVEGEGSSAYGPVQITKGLMEDPRYSDIVDPNEFTARQRLIEQSDKFLKYGNKDWQKLLNEGKISQEEAEEAQALYEYSMPGDFVRTEKDKEDYKNYTITVIDKILKELNIKDMNDKKKLIKFIRRWRGVDTDSEYEKDVLETIFPSSKKNLDN